MKILQALASTPLRWTVEPAEGLTSRNNPVPVLRMTMTLEPGSTPVTQDFKFSQTPETMVVGMLKAHVPAHPLLRQWYESKGNVPVTLIAGMVENASEGMHTALRKLADSKQSVITWRAIRHLHPSDNAAFWATARNVLTEAFASDKPVLRIRLASALQEALIAVVDERRGVRLLDEEGESVKRSELQDFALQMLLVGCEMTEMDEWMWGWLGYIVEDAPAAVAAPALAADEAPQS